MKKATKRDIWSKTSPPAADVDAFIESSPAETQDKLKELRSIIRSMVPEAEEKISYKMPVYKYKGKWLVGIAGFKKHVSLFGMSGTFFDSYQKELEGYKTSKGTIQFALDRPLPIKLIKKLIKARIKMGKTE